MLDMRTIVFSNVLTDIVCLVVIILLWQQTRRRFAGAGFFVFDFALQTTALFLIILRGQIPDWMSYVLANTMVMTGALLGYMGLSRFVGKKSFQIHNYILLAVFAFAHTYFTFVQPNLAARNLNLSLVLLIICLQCAWLMLYRVQHGMRPLTRGVGIVFGIYCLLSIIRIIEFSEGEHIVGDYFQSGMFEKLILVSYQILFIVLTYSLTLMVNKRLLVDIRTGEEKFSKAFYSSPYAITITRMSDGQIIEVNESFSNITGYQTADLQEKTTLAMHLWGRDEDRALVVSELAGKGKVRQREFQFRKKSGEIMIGLFSAEIITINNEKCVLSSINDITERKQNEEVLLASEEKFSRTFDSNPIATAISTMKDGRFLNVNNAMVGAFSFSSKEEIIGKTSVELGLFADPRQRQSIRKAVEETGRVHNMGLDMVAKDGRALSCLFSAEPILVNNEQCLLTTAVDISESRKAQKALKEKEQQYQNLFESSLEGIFQTSPEGRLLKANMAFVEMFGYESSEEAVSAVTDIAGQLYANHEERGKVINFLQKTGYLKDFECEMRRKDGTTFWTLINARFTGKQAGGRFFEGFIIDISTRKQAQNEIIRLNAELEQQVLARTDDLHQSQLGLLNLVEDMSQASKKIDTANLALAAINKELESFSYSVSHDLRAPLRSIDGFSQAMLEDYQEKLDDTGRNYLKKIRKATQNMGMLIDDMLKLSRVIQAEFRQEPVDLSKMVQDILSTQRQNSPARKVKVSVQKGIIVDGDRQMLEIALTNLIENAWKFTGTTENARIEFGKLLKDGKPVMFIRDNGAGFDMSYVNKLFGAFQRLHTKAEFVGTGIGLATVKRIITRHGGEVWAEGEVGKGASFYFTVPE
jgi:PAS domain S-box-containing protein